MERVAVNSLLLSGMALFIQLPAFATQNVTLAWNPSTDPTVVGYNIYYGGASGNYTNTLSAGNATNVTISGLVEGTTYYFAATSYNSSGVQSPFSNEVFYSVPTNTVAKPTVSIVTPKANQQWTNGTFTATGKAGDKVAVGTVYYALNGSVWAAATTTNNWTNWSANLTLTPGTNTVQAYAVDTSGNLSTTNTVRFVYLVRMPLTVSINGKGSINPKYNGTLLAINLNYTMTASASSGFAFTNWTGSLTTNSATLHFTMQTNLAFTANFADVAKPTVSIVTPKANQQETNGTFTATGKASDNVAVAAVYYALNGSPWTTATTNNNWTNWSANLTLIPGTNTVQACAVDTSGNRSTTNTVRFVYLVRMPLTVSIHGKGSVNPKYNGTLLAINVNYKMTASASSGFAFTNWTGSLTTNSATLHFTMQTNLAFTANFVDVARPTVSIVTPKANQQETNGMFTATGKASDNVAVGKVYYSLNGSAWTMPSTVNAWTNWSADLILIPGTNIVQAYAVDTSGNHSATNKVSFAYNTAPKSLDGLMGATTENGGGTFYLCFGSSTFSQNSGNTNYDNGVGDYSYKKLTPDTAQLSITYTAPPNISGTKTVVLLTFITNNECIFNNRSNAENTGTISFWSVPNWAPASLKGKTSALIADGQQTTIAFESSTLSITNAAGQVANGNYTFKQYSPLGALLTVKQPGETNYVELIFAATNCGAYHAAVYDGSVNTPTADAGVFALVSASPGGNAPNSLANLGALVTQADGTFAMNFGAATFDQSSFDTNYADGVGTYSYTQLGADSAELSINYAAPPTVSNNVGQVFLTFIAPNFCVFTNQDNNGSNIIAAISFWASPTNWIPTSLAGRTLRTTNAERVVDAVTFDGVGAFSQTETGSSNPGMSSGTYTFTPYSPLGGMLVLTYNGGVLNGSVSYIHVTFAGQGAGSYFATFYDALADPPVTGFGNFTID
jgi:hypothetical protein